MIRAAVRSVVIIVLLLLIQVWLSLELAPGGSLFSVLIAGFFLFLNMALSPRYDITHSFSRGTWTQHAFAGLIVLLITVAPVGPFRMRVLMIIPLASFFVFFNAVWLRKNKAGGSKNDPEKPTN